MHYKSLAVCSEQAKCISQSTFNAAVAENMVEFGMEKAEAVEDAIEQFKQQGVDLTGLDTTGAAVRDDGTIEEPERHPILAVTDDLAAALGGDGGTTTPADRLVELLATVAKLCSGTGAQEARSVGGDAGLVEHVCKAAAALTLGKDPPALPALAAGVEGKAGAGAGAASGADIDVDSAAGPALTPRLVLPGLAAVKALCVKHDANRKRLSPELFSVLLTAMHRVPDATSDEDCELLSACLTTASVVSVRQERFKIILMKGDLPALVARTLAAMSHRPAVVLATIDAMKAVTKDDDVNATISKTFQNARDFVAAGAIPPLFDLLRRHPEDPAIAGATFTALRHLACDDKICQEVTSDGGLDLITRTLVAHMTNEGVVADGMALLKTLAHSDVNKRLYCDPAVGTYALLLQTISTHVASDKVVEPAITAVAVTCLRHPEHATLVVSSGVFPLLQQAMRVHASKPGVQRQSCLAIRNIVARNPELRSVALEEGLEPLIRSIRINHPSVADVASAALRDLGLLYTDKDGGGVADDLGAAGDD